VGTKTHITLEKTWLCLL